MTTLAAPVRRLGESRTCRRVARQLPDLVERNAVADLAVHRHLRSCPACQAKLRQYRSLRHLMAELPVATTNEPPARERQGLVGVARDVAVGTAAAAAAALVLGRLVARRRA
jgi:hypothetical protein